MHSEARQINRKQTKCGSSFGTVSQCKGSTTHSGAFTEFVLSSAVVRYCQSTSHRRCLSPGYKMCGCPPLHSSKSADAQFSFWNRSFLLSFPAFFPSPLYGNAIFSSLFSVIITPIRVSYPLSRGLPPSLVLVLICMLQAVEVEPCPSAMQRCSCSS